MLTYHPLKITEVRSEGSDAVCVTLEVPDQLRDTFRFAPGQHIGVRATIDSQEVRRTYSICSGTDERHLRIGVRAIELLREAGVDQLHSRKLRSFAEVAFQ